MTLLTLKGNFSVQEIKLNFSGLSYLIYCNSLASFYQILSWLMFKPQKFCIIWCGMTLPENQKILLKTKSSGKTTSLGIWNNISPRSQKNHRILVKLSKTNWGSKLGLNYPHGLRQRVIRNAHIIYNRTFHLYLLDAKFQLLGICRSQLYLGETTDF